MAKIEYSLLGKGLRYPFTINRHNGVMMNEEIERINQSLFILFETEKGSRINQPQYGSDLEKYRFEPFDEVLVDRLDYVIRECVATWEPRITLGDIQFKATDRDKDACTLYISVNYHIINTDIEANYVYPFRMGTMPTLRKEEVYRI